MVVGLHVNRSEQCLIHGRITSKIYIHNFRVLGRGLAQLHSMNLNEIKPIGRDGEKNSQTCDVIWFERLRKQMETFSDKLTDAELRRRFVVLD